jgi:hypothetical protein
MPRIIVLLICFSSCLAARSQAIYRFSFQQPDNSQSRGLLILQPDGTAFIRVAMGTAIAEQRLEELITPHAPDTAVSFVIYEGKESKLIKGAGTLPVFDLKLNIVNAELVPSAMIFRGAPSTERLLDSVVFLNNAQLTRVFLQDYFLPTEPFYTQLFNNSTRALTPLEKSTRIHLLIVANTNDSTVGVAAVKDMQTVESFFTDLTEVMGIKQMEVYKVSGNSFSKGNVLSAMQKLKPQPNDIVVFYYTGHGFRTQNKTTAYPLFDLRANPKQNYLTENLSTDTIAQLIKMKGPRMSLVLSDCCNWNPDMPLPYVPADPGTRSTEIPWDVDKCRALFFNRKISQIIGVAADKNQLAVSNEAQGSFFFKYFRESLITAISKTYRSFGSGQDWYYITESTKNQTFRKSKKTYCSKPYIPTNICNQTPRFLIQ